MTNAPRCCVPPLSTGIVRTPQRSGFPRALVLPRSARASWGTSCCTRGARRTVLARSPGRRTCSSSCTPARSRRAPRLPAFRARHLRPHAPRFPRGGARRPGGTRTASSLRCARTSPPRRTTRYASPRPAPHSSSTLRRSTRCIARARPPCATRASSIRALG